MNPDMTKLAKVLAESKTRHRYLCPRQVLGARIGLAGAAALDMDVPRQDKRLLVIVETDGCFVDGVATATGCAVGHRTLRVEDYGKVAATFVHVDSGLAVRVSPRHDVRQRAWDYAKGEKKRYEVMLTGYQTMPTDKLLAIQPVYLTTPISSIISRAGVRVNCQRCGEEIINEREVVQDGQILCQACAGPAYYQAAEPYEFIATPQLQENLPLGIED